MDASASKKSSPPASGAPPKKRRRCLSEAAREKKRLKRLARLSIPVDPSRAHPSHSGHPALLPTPRQFWAPTPARGDIVALKLAVEKEESILASVAIVDLLGRVVYEAICTPPADARIVKDQDRPISERHFRVTAAEQVSIESVQEQVRTLLEGRIVVGFDITNDLKVLGVSLPPEMVRDLQLHFSAERCSKPDLCAVNFLLLVMVTKYTASKIWLSVY